MIEKNISKSQNLEDKAEDLPSETLCTNAYFTKIGLDAWSS
jgi:hypothetical protein